MKNTIITIFLLLWGLSGFSQSLETQSTASAGGSISNSTVQLSWTIGETIVETFMCSDNKTLTQGIHQTTFVVSAVTDNLPHMEVKIFPNPTSQHVYIEFEKEEKDLKLQLYTIDGTLVYDSKIQNQKNFTIDLRSYPSGIFLLSLKNNNKIKSYKIIKK